MSSIIANIDSELRRVGTNPSQFNNPKFNHLSGEQRMILERMSQIHADEFIKEMDNLIAKAKEENVGLEEFEMNILLPEGKKVEYYIHDISNIYITLDDIIVVCNICTLGEKPIFKFHFLLDDSREEINFWDYASLLRNYKRAVKG